MSIRILAILACLVVASAAPIVDGDNAKLWATNLAAERRFLADSSSTYDYGTFCQTLGKGQCISNRKYCSFITGEDEDGNTETACIEKGFACSDLEKSTCKLDTFKNICEVSGGKCKPIMPTCKDFSNKAKCEGALLTYEGLVTCEWTDPDCTAITVRECSDIPDKKSCVGAFEGAKFLKLDKICAYSGGACADDSDQCQLWSGTSTSKCHRASAKAGYICKYDKDTKTCAPATCSDFNGKKNSGECKQLEDFDLCKFIKKSTCTDP